MHPPRSVRVLGATLTVAAAVTLAGCSADSSDSSGGSATDPAATPATAGASATLSSAPTSSTSPPASSAAPGSGGFSTYVALGDSYTAAPGVPTTETDDGCLRSDGNYPALLAAAIGASLTDVSCSGASTTSLVGVQQTGAAQIPPQFEALTEDTSLVTMGIGGNDENLFSTAVVTCLQAAASDPTGHPCQDAEQASGGGKGDALLSKVSSVRGLVTAALRGVRDRSPSAKIVLVGYPQPVPMSGSCASLPLATGDYAYVRKIFTALDQALQTAAQRAGATYVDVATASQGHDICSADPWVNGAANAPGRAIAFHPFAVEQQAVATLVQQAIATT